MQWSGLYPEDATWEPLKELLAAYPTLYLEDKVFFEDMGYVLTPSPTHHMNEEAHNEPMVPMPRSRAKINKMRPKWMRDFEFP